MTTRSELLSQISEWAVDVDDITGQLPTAIRDAEDRIARTVRILEMETTETLTSNEEGNIDLPTGFLGLVSFRPVDGKGSGTYSAPDVLGRYEEETISFTIESNQIRTSSPSSADYRIVYFKRFDALTDPDDTNYLLANHFNIYLFAALWSVFDFQQDEAQADRFDAKFEQAVSELYDLDAMKRSPGGPLIRKQSRRLA